MTEEVNRDEQKAELTEKIERLEKEERREQIKEEIGARLKDESIWLRLLQLIVFGFAAFIAGWVLFGSVVLQFLLRLLTGEPNPELQRFGKSLAVYFSQIINFALFNTDDMPFPFSEWPKED